MNKKIIYILLAVLFVIFLILALVFNNKANHAIENSIKTLNQFSNDTKTDASYIYIDTISEDSNGYAIVFDKENASVVYLNEELSNDIKNYAFYNRAIKLVGDSMEITDDAKINILSIYNKESKVGDEDYLSINDFSEVFGIYYLDVKRIEADYDLHKTDAFLSSLFLDISLVSLLILALSIKLERSN